MNNEIIKLLRIYETLKKHGLPSSMIKEALINQAKKLGIPRENIEKAKEKDDPLEIISILAQKPKKKHIIPVLPIPRAQRPEIAKKHIIQLLGGQIVIKEGEELEIWLEIDEPSNYKDVRVHFGQIVKITGKPLEV